jgi:hypothetical protein
MADYKVMRFGDRLGRATTRRSVYIDGFWGHSARGQFLRMPHSLQAQVHSLHELVIVPLKQILRQK